MIFAYILVSLNCLICVTLFLRKRRANSPFQVFFLLLLLIAILPGYSHTVLGIVQFHPFSPALLIDESVIIQSHLIILGYLLAFLLFDLIWPSQQLTVMDQDKFRSGLGFYWTIPIMIIGLILFALWGGIEIYTSSFEDLREGPIGAYYLTIFYLQIIIIGLPAYLILIRKNLLFGLAIFLGFAYLQIAFGGSRQILFISLFMIIFLRFQKYRLFSSLVIVISFYLTFEMLNIILQTAKLFRNQPDMYARIALIPDLLKGSIDLSGTSSGEVIVFPMYILLTRELPVYFGEFQYFLRTLLFWMPSFLDFFDIKPPDFEYDVFAFVMGGHEGTMHATFFGNTYADTKLFFIVWVALFALFFKFMENMILRFSGIEYVLLWSACIYFSVMTARGSLYAPFLVSFVVLVSAFGSKVLRKNLFSRVGSPVIHYGHRRN